MTLPLRLQGPPRGSSPSRSRAVPARTAPHSCNATAADAVDIGGAAFIFL